MAYAMQSVQVYGIEAEEPVNKRYRQCAILAFTGLNTDIDLDIGDYSGTFWTAVGGTEPGTTALKAIKDIQQRALSFINVKGSSIAGYSQADASAVAVSALDSAASAGGAATETLVVTGLLTTDTILAATEQTKGASKTALINYESAASVAGKLAVEWTANPGAGSVIRVVVARAGQTAPVNGTYSIQMDATNTNIPNLLFLSGDAPTSYKLVLEWVLKPQETPVEVDASV